MLGVAVEEGEHIVPNSLSSCGWMGPGGASIGSKKMVLSLMSARSFEAGKTPVKGVTEITASGIGDEAYYISMPPFGTALSVRKGGAYFQLRIAGYPSGQVRNAREAPGTGAPRAGLGFRARRRGPPAPRETRPAAGPPRPWYLSHNRRWLRGL